MTRDQFKIVAKYYDTNSLTYIFYLTTIIGYVEVYSDLYFKEVEKDKWESQKKKRKPDAINAECEVLIKKYIAANS
jgi:hypothetical protein